MKQPVDPLFLFGLLKLGKGIPCISGQDNNPSPLYQTIFLYVGFENAFRNQASTHVVTIAAINPFFDEPSVNSEVLPETRTGFKF